MKLTQANFDNLIELMNHNVSDIKTSMSDIRKSVKRLMYMVGGISISYGLITIGALLF